MNDPTQRELALQLAAQLAMSGGFSGEVCRLETLGVPVQDCPALYQTASNATFAILDAAVEHGHITRDEILEIGEGLDWQMNLDKTMGEAEAMWKKEGL